MALTQSALELASSLSQNEIPIKLRCAICNRLATNAVRLPCCDQSICQSCHSTLPESCLVCEHSPLSADDCKPNKALRLTVKAFLKSEEKKRDKGKNGAGASKIVQQEPTSRVESAEDGAPKEEALAKGYSESNVASNAGDQIHEPNDTIDYSASTQAQEKAEGPYQATNSNAATNNPPNLQAARINAEAATVGDKAVDIPENDKSHDKHNNEANDYKDAHQQIQFPGQQNFDGMQAEHNGMDWPNMGGFNAMMQSQNGMPNTNWNWMQNMMGMTGMDMDPMAMAQGFFGGFGGQGMGMNSMAGNVNMNNMGFEGGYGGWQDQQGMGMNGEYGADAGYYSNNGYNNPHHFQGHPYHRMHFQNSQSTSFQNKNYIHGRGRGFMHNNPSRGLPNRYRGGHVNARGFNESRNSVANQQNALPQDVAAARQGQGDAFFHQLPAGLQDGRPADQSPELAEAYRKQDMIINMHKGGDLPNADAKGGVDAGEGDSSMVGGTVDLSSKQSNRPNGANSLPIALAMNDAGDAGVSVGTATGDANDGAGQNGEPMSMQIKPIESTSSERTDQEYLPHEAPGMGRASNGDVTAMSANTYQAQHFPGAVNYRGSFRGRGNFFRGRGGRGGYGDYRGNFRGRAGHAGGFSAEAHGAGYNGSGLSEPIGQGVEGAPKGPKAMREGASQLGARGRDAHKGLARQDMPPPGSTKSMEEDKARERRSSPDAYGATQGAEDERRRSRSTSSDGGRSRQRGERRRSQAEDHHDRYLERKNSNVESSSMRNGNRSSNRDRSRSPEYNGERGDRRSSRRERDDRWASRRHHEPSASPPASGRNRNERRSRRSRDENCVEESGRSPARHESSREREDKYRESDRRRRRRSDHEQGYDDDDNDRNRKRSKREREDSPQDYSEDDGEHRRRRRSKRSKRDESHHVQDDYIDVVHDGGHTDKSVIRPKREAQDNVSPVEVEFKIKDRSKKSRRQSSASHQNGLVSPAIPTGPAAAAAISTNIRKSSTTTDPHTLEREARDRERLLKEVQRRQQSSQKQQQRSSKSGVQQVQPQTRVIARSPPPLHAPTGPAADKKIHVANSSKPLPPTEPSALRRSRKERKRASRDERELDDCNGEDAGHDISENDDRSREREKEMRRRERNRHGHADRHDKTERKERRRKSHRDDYAEERGEEGKDRERERERERERDRDRERDRSGKKKGRDKEKDREKGRSARRAEVDEARTRRVESEREAARWR